uniref:Fcf2 pre-rRNA processing C-terminal domain-containing protein n=1 Tax=Ciona savignyi TaxID=51511 RepID=H2YPK3_CIOSA
MPRRSTRLLSKKNEIAEKNELEILKKEESEKNEKSEKFENLNQENDEEKLTFLAQIDKVPEESKSEKFETEIIESEKVDVNCLEKDSEIEQNDSDFDVETLADQIADKLVKNMNLKSRKPKVKLISTQNEDSKIEAKQKSNCPSSRIDVGDLMDDSYITVDPAVHRNNILELYSSNDVVMKKSVLTPDFEAKHQVPAELNKRAKTKQRRLQKKLTTGGKWFNMKPPEMTEEIENDLKVLQMRSILDPKRFYKHNDRKTLPKYFQMGRIMDNAADFYSSRIPKKQRKSTLVDELMADAKFKKYQKRKFNEIQAKRRALGFKPYARKLSRFSKHKK